MSSKTVGAVVTVKIVQCFVLLVFTSGVVRGNVKQDTSETIEEDPFLDGLEEVEEIRHEESPGEVELTTQVDSLFREICVNSFGNCWRTLKTQKVYLTEERRRQLCQRKIREWDICQMFGDDDEDKAIEEGERQIKEDSVLAAKQETRETKVKKRKDTMARQFKVLEKQHTRIQRAVSTGTQG